MLLLYYKKVLQTLRLSPNINNNEFTIIDKFIALIIYGMVFMSLSFLLIDTQSIKDLTVGLYTASVYLLYSIAYTIMIKKKLELFQLFADIEEKVKSRKTQIQIRNSNVFQ